MARFAPRLAYDIAQKQRRSLPSQVSINQPAPPVPLSDTQTLPTYEDFLKGAGSSYAAAYSPDYLNAQYDPYFNFQKGGAEQERQLAQEQLGRNLQQTQQNYGQTFENRGLYGSGIYQQELGKALDNLNRGFEQNYGAGQYTPFSLRLQEIEQQRKLAKEQAALSRQGQAFQAYQQQYYPQFAQ